MNKDKLIKEIEKLKYEDVLVGWDSSEEWYNSEQESSLDEEKSFVDEDSSETSKNETKDEVKIKEVGGEILDFSSSYVQDESSQIEKIEKAVTGLSEKGKEELFKKLV